MGTLSASEDLSGKGFREGRRVDSMHWAQTLRATHSKLALSLPQTPKIKEMGEGMAWENGISEQLDSKPGSPAHEL